MNSVPNECVGMEVDAEVTNEMDADLVEVGAVSETKAGFGGVTLDPGGSWQRF
jgi:hypothetical protein